MDEFAIPRPQSHGPSLKGRAIRLLAGREHSRQELERKLAAHAESPAALTAVLDELAAKDLQSDARALAALIHRRGDKLGNLRLCAELREKGFAPELIAQYSEQFAASEMARAEAVWQKKFKTPAQDRAELAKQQRFLASRGFAASTISRLLRQRQYPAD